MLVVAALGALAGGVAGQSTRGALLGAVLSAETGHPVPGALVFIEGAGRAVTDGDGVFVFEDLPAKHYRIAGVAPGCHIGLGEVEIIAEQVVRARVEMALSEQAEGSLAAWRDERASSEATRSMGTLEFRRRQVRSLHDAVRLLAPDMIGSASGQSGSRASVRGRRSATVESPPEALVVVDGVRTGHRPEDVLASLDIDDVDRIDVYMGAAGGWRFGPQGADGAIEITTRAGVAQALAVGPRPEDCGFHFPPPGAVPERATHTPGSRLTSGRTPP
jgi:hypothetical protein